MGKVWVDGRGKNEPLEKIREQPMAPKLKNKVVRKPQACTMTSMSLGGDQGASCKPGILEPLRLRMLFFQRSNLDTAGAWSLLVLLQVDQELAETLLA